MVGMVWLDASTDLLPRYRFSHERILSLHALGRHSQQNLTGFHRPNLFHVVLKPSATAH